MIARLPDLVWFLIGFGPFIWGIVAGVFAWLFLSEKPKSVSVPLSVIAGLIVAFFVGGVLVPMKKQRDSVRVPASELELGPSSSKPDYFKDFSPR